MMTFMQVSNAESVQKIEGEINFSPSVSVAEEKINPEDLWRSIHAAITRVLTRRFSDDRKRKIKAHSDRLAFACPFCGDSTRDASKKRGNLFLDSMNYHCFNGDCNTHMSLFFFLKEQHEIDTFSQDEIAYIKFKISSRNSNGISLKKIKVSQDVESMISEEAMSLTISREHFMKHFKLQEIKGSRIERYLRQRLQTQFQKFAFEPKKGVLYVFNLSRDQSRILGFQIKTFNKRTPYLTYKTSGMHKELKIYKEENRDLLNKLDIISSIFGIMSLDLNRTITVFEGPLDSFLFPNSVGVCSAKNDFPLDVESLRYFYDNDPTGKDWAMKRLEEGFPVFMWRKYIQDSELGSLESKIKDLNDLLIEVNRKSLKVKKFADFFSTDKYDMVWL
jgi:hypothetical protein